MMKGTKEIPLTRGFVAIVDAEDYERLNQWKWYAKRVGANSDGFYASSITRVGGKGNNVLMHRLVNNTPKGMVTDHINHNTLDNRKINLRNATRAQNLANMTKRPGLSSKYKGVSRCKREKMWKASICFNGKSISLGTFNDENDAGLAYNLSALKYYGEYAHLNQLETEE